MTVTAIDGTQIYCDWFDANGAYHQNVLFSASLLSLAANRP
jgi:hypothetical protein